MAVVIGGVLLDTHEGNLPTRMARFSWEHFLEMFVVVAVAAGCVLVSESVA